MTLASLTADLYTPLLVLAYLYYWKKETQVKRRLRIIVLLLSLTLVYGLMLLDNSLKIWPALAMDYSTHSALALVFVIDISMKNKKMLLFAPLSLFIYFYLMWFLDYHSVADMLTTSMVLLPVLFYLHKKGR
ncbi:hypothetical protein [Psychromonas ossibalaenae]|uniref:hypothetical protein n=1 Tax=Psychromonas ossibalaenae TaxID=444922 RepID=UPI00035DA27B|nr:hypothetical protein [Psychromonas ossibalaenae]